MENGLLSVALDKIRGGDGGAVSSLGDEEAQALSTFLSRKVAETGLSESDQLLCRHIRIVLQERALRIRQSGSEQHFQRTNLALRAAIDLFLARDYGAVLAKDVALLRETQARLSALVATDSSPNHARLNSLIDGCLNAYGEWRASQNTHAPSDTPPEPTIRTVDAPAPATDPAGTLNAREFLGAAGTRESIRELEGIPMTASVRVLVHEGNLSLEGELSDEFLVHVRHGTLSVRGGVSGMVVADGDITVHGSVQGGWLFSRKGSIQSERALAGSVLIAPEGNVSTESAEGPRLVYCGKDFTSKIGVRAGAYFTRDMIVGEGVRNARIYLRGSLRAQSVDVDPHDDSADIQFRLAQTCQDFGRPVEENTSAALRNFARNRYRRRIYAALLHYLESDRLALQRLRLFALQSGATEIGPVAAIRYPQVEMALLPVLLEVGEGLKEIMVLGENIGLNMAAALVNVGVEESTNCLAIVAKEITMMARGLLRDREMIEAPCRHIASFAKKLKDTLRLGQAADKLLYDFDFRMDEWRGQLVHAQSELEQQHVAMAQVLGAAIWQVEDCDRLNALLARMLQTAEESGKVPRSMASREMNALREHVEQHNGNCKTWQETAEATAQDYAQALLGLQESIGLAVASEGEQELAVASMGSGVRIQTLASIKKISGSTGAMALVTGGQAGNPTRILMRNLRLYPEDTNEA